MGGRSLLVLLGALLFVACAGTRRTGAAHDGRSEWQLSWIDSSSTENGGGAAERNRSDAHPPKPDRPAVKSDLPPPKPDLPCPGGCNDGNACTVDACGAKGCTHSPAGQVITRYYNPSTGAHAYALAGSQPPGFNSEGAYFRTLTAAVAGSAALFEQSNSSGDYMLSTSATEGIACCGYTNWAQLGWGFGGNSNGSIPLYRLYHPSGLHFSSTSSTEGTNVGYTLEGITLYVCPL